MKQRSENWNRLQLLLFGVILLLKTYSVKYTFWENSPPSRGFIIGTLGSVILLLAVLLLFQPKARFTAFLILNLVVSLILVADVVYNRYFRDVTSVALLKQARLAREVQDSVWALIQPRDLTYFIDLVILAPVLWIKKKAKHQATGGGRFRYRLAAVLVCILIGSLLVQNSANALQSKQPGLLKTFYDKKCIASHIGPLNFHIWDAYRYVKKQVTQPSIDVATRDNIAAWFAANASDDSQRAYHGQMQGKNLIMIQLEAFQGFVLHQEINGQPVTPNLNKLAAESLVFNNAYCQTAWGGTSDAEFLANVSLLPAREGSAFYEFSSNSFVSLPRMLKEQGYTSMVMHANRPGFWNRTHMYNALGFDHYFSEVDFDIDDTFGLGLTDHSFYRQAVQQMRKADGPFYSFLISLSSHFPYVDSTGNYDLREQLDVGQWQGTFIGNFLQSVHFADEAIGVLIEELKAAGLWDNSIIVIYGDHHAVPFDKRDQLAQLLYGQDDLDQLEWQKEQKVVMMMRLPHGQLRGENNMSVGQIDILPTVANLLGLHNPYALGQDMLNAPEGFVCLRNGRWLNDEVYYLSASNQVLDLATGEELPATDYADIIDKARTHLRISDLTLEHNLISKFAKTTGR